MSNQTSIEEKAFAIEKKLEEADYETVKKHEYICLQIDCIEEDLEEAREARVSWIVDQEVDRRMGKKEDEAMAKIRIKEIDKKIDELEDMYEIYIDLCEELYIDLLGYRFETDRKRKNPRMNQAKLVRLV